MRPYKNSIEFLEAQKEHGPNFRNKDSKVYFGYSHFDEDSVSILYHAKNDNKYGYNTVSTKQIKWDYFFEEFEWQDETPCGILEK